MRRLHGAVDGAAVDSCLMLGVEADGTAITTVEGLATGDRLDPLQRVPGDRCRPVRLLHPGPADRRSGDALTEPDPTRADVEEGLAGNLCRCAGYEQIIEAVLAAAGAPGDATTAQPPRARRARASDPAATPDARLAPQ
jgi:carbon-monoxide dehydrogenase small subunit